MSRGGQEVVLEGWLTKSPPTKRLWRARWRRRWFSLQNSGELPGQYFLTYYTDRKCRKLKGTINLDHCEQVDTGLKFEDNKYKFEYMFDIKTPMRTYYLAADTEDEMKAWVSCICNICGLTATADDETVTRSLNPSSPVYEVKQNESVYGNAGTVDSPPVSPVSTSPYIPISECITGRLPSQGAQDFYKLLEHNLRNSYFRTNPSRSHNNETYESAPPTYLNDINSETDPRFYDSPRRLQPPPKPSDMYINIKSDKNGSPLQSPTDSESVFTDEDWPHNTSFDNAKKSSGTDVHLTESLNKMSLDDVTKTLDPPPRPPKPTNITTQQNYLNLSSQSTISKNSSKDVVGDQEEYNEKSRIVGLTDEMYDFPRSHQLDNPESMPGTLRRHCYNNAAPVNLGNDERIFRYDDLATKPGTSFSQVLQDDGLDLSEPASPLSQCSSSTAAAYSDLSSPLLPSDTQLMPPPQINRSLKPKRKLSDSLSVSSSIEPSSPRPAPSVDRTCKPVITAQGIGMRKTYESDAEYNRRIRAAPSPTPPLDNVYGNQQMCSFYEDKIKRKGKGDLSRVQYLDLDHSASQYGTSSSKQQPLRSPGASTVYKQVDFIKTEAFNITRQGLEMERNESVTSYKK